VNAGRVILGGIGYRLDVHEGMATFVERDRMSCARITIQKSSPHDLLYVQATSATGFVPYSHIKKAAAVCESLFGPNHYASLKNMHRSERNIAASHILRRPIFKPNQRLFWSHEIPFRIASVWRVMRHHLRLLLPERTPRIEWDSAT
jgi:hypothetical protein